MTVGARTAGVFWLLTILTGALAMFLGDKVVVSSDAAATAASVVAQQSWLRLGVAANLVATACYLAATVLVYRLLVPVNRNVSLLAAFFSIVGCTVGTVGLVFQLGPLIALGGAPYLGVFTTEQLQALALLLLRWGRQAGTINFAFFGLHVLLIGCLIFRSTFLPRFVGVLMVFGGLGWLTFSFANLLSPPLARSLSPYIMAPGILGETALTLWLLVRGVNAERFEQQAVAASAWRS